MIRAEPDRGRRLFTFFYLHPDLGPDFIRALGKQITIMKDFAQKWTPSVKADIRC